MSWSCVGVQRWWWIVSRTASWEEVLESIFLFARAHLAKGLACLVSIHPALSMPYSGALQAWVGPPRWRFTRYESSFQISWPSCSPLTCSNALMQFGQEGLISHFDILPWHHADFSQEQLNRCTFVFHTCSVDPPSRLQRTEPKSLHNSSLGSHPNTRTFSLHGGGGNTYTVKLRLMEKKSCTLRVPEIVFLVNFWEGSPTNPSKAVWE